MKLVLLKNGEGDKTWYFSIGPSVGLDASAGIISKNIYMDGPNVKNTLGSYYGGAYQEFGFGMSLGSPLSYTREFNYTWVGN